MKTLYLECNMGAAGDMLLSALYELLEEKEEFLQKMNSLGLPGVRLEAERGTTCGIAGTLSLIHIFMPTITIMFILRIGQLMNLDQEKILLLYNPITYETADVISTYVYRKGLLDQSYSFSAAIGLFNSIINFILVISANKISKAVNETSLW